MNRYIILFLLCLPALAWGQHYFKAELPRSLEDNPDYLFLLEEKARLGGRLHQWDLRVWQSALPEEEKSAIRQLLDTLFNTQKPLAETWLDSNRLILPDLLNRDSLLAAEQRLARLNRDIFILENGVYAPDEFLDNGALYMPYEFRKRIKQLGIKDGETLLEIGASNVQFLAGLNKFRRGLTVYANEIDTNKLKRVAYQLEYSPHFQSKKNTFHPILGTPGSTSMEGIIVDKILMKSTFHHFDQPREMLQSIRRSMDDRTEVVLYEGYREKCQERCCPRLLTRAEIMDLFSEMGYRLKSEKKYGELKTRQYWIMKWVVD